LGSGRNFEALIDKVNSPEFLTALGLVVWGYGLTGKKSRFNLHWPGGEVVDKSVEKIKKWFTSLIP